MLEIKTETSGKIPQHSDRGSGFGDDERMTLNLCMLHPLTGETHTSPSNCW